MDPQGSARSLAEIAIAEVGKPPRTLGERLLCRAEEWIYALNERNHWLFRLYDQDILDHSNQGILAVQQLDRGSLASDQQRAGMSGAAPGDPATRQVLALVGGYDFHLFRGEDGWRIDLFRFNLKYIDGNPDLEGGAG